MYFPKGSSDPAPAANVHFITLASGCTCKKLISLIYFEIHIRDIISLSFPNPYYIYITDVVTNIESTKGLFQGYRYKNRAQTTPISSDAWLSNPISQFCFSYFA